MSCVRVNTSRDTEKLSAKQRLTLIVDTAFPASSILSMDDTSIDAVFLKKHSFPTLNIKASGLTPMLLKKRGLADAEDLVNLGFDALHLVDSVFCESAIAAYGAPSVVQAFVKTATDAVAIAGTSTVQRLGLTQETLLQLCAGASIEALAVITQTKEHPLRGVFVSTLLDTGLRSKQLTSVGLTTEVVGEMIGSASLRTKLWSQ